MKPYARHIIMSMLISIQTLLPAQEQIYTYRNFSLKDGLKTSSFKAIAQDHDGFIWVGGDNGLNRYDGHRFKPFPSPLDSADFTVNSLLQNILFDKKYNRLWLISFSDIQYFDLYQYTFHRIPHIRDDRGQSIRTELTSVYKRSDDLLWVSLAGQINEFDIQKGSWNLQHPKISPPQGTDLRWALMQPYTTDSLAILYKNVLLILNLKNLGFTSIPAEKDELFVRCYYDTSRHLLHIAANSGLVTIHRANGVRSKKVFNYKTAQGALLQHHIVEVSRFDANTLMLSGMGGHILYQPDKDHTTLYPQQSGDYANALSAFQHFTDREGNIWRISLTDYVNVLYTQNRHITRYGPLTNDKGINIEPYKTRQLNDSILLFCGSWLIGLGWINLSSGNIGYMTDPSFSNSGTTDFTITPSGKIYICNAQGIFEFNPGTHTYSKLLCYRNGEKIIPFARQLTTIGSNLFCYTEGQFYLIDPDRRQIKDRIEENKLPHPSTQAEPSYVTLLKANEDVIYFSKGTYIYQYDIRNQQVKLWDLPEDPITRRKPLDVIDMEIDSRGKFWFASFSNGLFCYDPETNNIVNVYSGNSQLQSDYVTSITLDASEHLWIGSHDNVYLMNTQSLEVEITLTPAYGIEGAGYEVEYQSASGKLSINTFPYISILHWNNFPRNVCSQPPLITGITASGKPVISVPTQQDTLLVLRHHENNLDILFTALCFNNSEGNRYRYRLTGIDPQWIITTANQATYHRLESGRYTFEIQAANNEGKWHPETRTITFLIRPVFYKAWWFLAGMALLILTLAYLGYQQRISSIRSEEKIKRDYDKRLAEIEMKALRAQMNPHFIFNALNSIQKFIFEKDEYAASQYLTKFSRLIRLILDHSHQEFISIHSEKELLGHYLEMESLRFDQHFTYTLETGPGVNEEWQIPSMVIQPHVENAIWHGLLHKQGDCHVLIRFETENNAGLRIIIKDNGVGRARALEMRSKQVLKKKSYGSSLSAERIKKAFRMQEHEASMTITDLTDGEGHPAGTRVTILLPIIQPGTPILPT